jgi:hypothetical protein
MQGQNAIYNSEVLTGLVQDFKHQTLQGLAMMPNLQKNKIVGINAEWDIEHTNRELAPFNMPGNEAHRKDPRTFTNKLEKFMYIREKTPLSAPTVKTLRAPGGPKNQIRGEKAVEGELRSLDNFVMNRPEWAVWQMFGEGTVTYNNDGQQFTVDYQIPANNKVTATVDWSNFTNADPQTDIDALQRVISRTSGRMPTDMWITKTVNNYLLQNAKIRELIRTQGGLQMLAENKITRLMEMDVHIYDNTYKIGATTYTFITEDYAILLPKSTEEDEIYDLQEGSPQDFDAPDDMIGKFSKMWIDKDPSRETVLIDWSFLPILKVPGAVGRINTVA